MNCFLQGILNLDKILCVLSMIVTTYQIFHIGTFGSHCLYACGFVCHLFMILDYETVSLNFCKNSNDALKFILLELIPRRIHFTAYELE